jgi:hypothetical protein
LPVAAVRFGQARDAGAGAGIADGQSRGVAVHAAHTRAAGFTASIGAAGVRQRLLEALRIAAARVGDQRKTQGDRCTESVLTFEHVNLLVPIGP